MHHALEIQEILLNIIAHCRSPRPQAQNCLPDLASLARTCRSFKDPALDKLWEELYDLSPLVRCLSKAFPSRPSHPGSRLYSFTRSLTLREWDILRNYTRRVRSLVINFRTDCFDYDSLLVFHNAPTDEPLFQNLCHLSCTFANNGGSIHLLHLPFPSLISLNLLFARSVGLQDRLALVSRFSLNLRKLSIHFYGLGATLDNTSYIYIGQWRNLQTLESLDALLDAELLVQLSCMPTLTRLAFRLGVTSESLVSSPPLFFSHLQDLELRSKSWGPVSKFLSQVRLPAVTNLTAGIFRSPSRQDDLALFFAGLQTSGVNNTIQVLHLNEPLAYHDRRPNASGPLLGLDDLWPCTAFTNIHHMELDISWNVALTDSDLLTLTSAWPHLETFSVNSAWGWNTSGGITPNGLLRLLQACRSLSDISIAINARGFTKFSPSQESAGLTLSRPLRINVLDSAIEEEEVPAISAFFAGIAPSPRSDVSFSAWNTEELWRAVWALVRDIQRGCENDLLSESLRNDEG